MLSASYKTILLCSLMSDSISTVTNNHILETSHRKWGQIPGLILLPQTKKKKKKKKSQFQTLYQHYKYQGGFYHDALISVDFLSHAEKVWGLQTSKHDVMDWFVNQMWLSAFSSIQCSLGWKSCTPVCCLENGHEGECHLKSLILLYTGFKSISKLQRDFNYFNWWLTSAFRDS